MRGGAPEGGASWVPEPEVTTAYGPSALRTPANFVTVTRLLVSPVLFGLIADEGASWLTFWLWVALAALGSGAALPPALAEGAATAPVARDLAHRLGVPMPITEAVAAILDGSLSVDAAAGALMLRPLKREAD